MSLFSDIPSDQGLKSVVDAVKCLQNRLAKLAGPGPHSLCELGIDDSDYQWLCQWAERLPRGTLSLSRWMAGALVLLLAAEAARRDAQEGHVWPVNAEPLPA